MASNVDIGNEMLSPFPSVTSASAQNTVAGATLPAHAVILPTQTAMATGGLRDFVGYGRDPPNAKWPGNARIAVNFVLNYEEGGENCVLDGDNQSEWLLSEIVSALPLVGARHINVESLYEYGSRAGFWRLHRLFTEKKLPLTVYAVGLALEKNEAAAHAMAEAGWEIASHGYRWIDYQNVPPEVERVHIQKAINVHKRLFGRPPSGFYQGKPNVRTRGLLVEAGVMYDSDSYADDLPYYVYDYGKPHLVIPYTLDVNDMRFASPQGFNCGEHFFSYLKDAFDVLYEEGATTPKMMTIGLHCRLVGRPGRLMALRRFIEYVQSKQDVWICRREEIAKHWLKTHPPKRINIPSKL